MYDLFGIARERRATILGVDVELLRIRPEIIKKGSQDVGTDPPPVSCFIGVEESVLDLDRFVRELVRFGDA